MNFPLSEPTPATLTELPVCDSECDISDVWSDSPDPDFSQPTSGPREQWVLDEIRKAGL